MAGGRCVMRFEPHAYQQYAIDRIVADECVGLFLDMGLGKTTITLTAINRLLYERFAIRKALVIAPKTVAEATWTAEAGKWEHLQNLRVVRVLGTEKKRIDALGTEADVYVINRENVPWLVDHLQNAWDFDMVVLDESTSFKNPRAQRFRSLKKVRPRIRRLVALTGTPSPNGMEDLWAQIYLLDGGKRLGRSMTAFRDHFFRQDYVRPGQMYRTYSLLPGADEKILKQIEDICISMTAADYLTLPDYIEDMVPVVLDGPAQKAYDRMKKEALIQYADTVITAASAAVLNGKLLQLCSGSVYDVDGKPIQIHDCKLQAFRELVEQLNGEHALVFYWFEHERDALTESIDKMGLSYRVYHGEEDMDLWNSGKLDLLLAHPASCGYGLNLQAGGHHIIWYGYPNWNLELYQQSNKRLHRQGQEHPVICHHLVVHGGVDEAVVAALHSKGDAQDEIIRYLAAEIGGAS